MIKVCNLLTSVNIFFNSSICLSFASKRAFLSWFVLCKKNRDILVFFYIIEVSKGQYSQRMHCFHRYFWSNVDFTKFSQQNCGGKNFAIYTVWKSDKFSFTKKNSSSNELHILYRPVQPNLKFPYTISR